jgi:hypothetical protein
MLSEELAGSKIDGFFENGPIKSVATGLTMAGFAAPESVAASMAGFAGERRQPGGLTVMPAAFK